MSHKLLPEIETSRLRMRVCALDDVESMFSIWTDPDVSQYFSPLHEKRTKEQAIEYLLRINYRWRERGYSQWGITLKPSHEVIGYCGFQPLEKTSEVEIYYGFPRQHWRQGFATEAARAALRFGFEALELPRIVAVTHLENTASHRVLNKIGMKFEGNKHLYQMDVCYFSIDRESFEPDDSVYKLCFN